MAYDNIIRPGVRSSSNADPKILEKDLSTKLQRVDASSQPIQTLASMGKKGAKPKSHKVSTLRYYSFDAHDFSPSCEVGSNGWDRFALIEVEQRSRPSVDNMYYQPQDKLALYETGQTVEVVMNPTSTLTIDGSPFVLDNDTQAAFSGLADSTDITRTPKGYILVMNVEPVPLMPFDSSHVMALGRHIHESQDIGATSYHRDFVFDTNFVEHKEYVLSMTEDQKKWVQTLQGLKPDFTFQQEETIREAKMLTDLNLMWSERNVNTMNRNRLKRSLRGLFHAIQSNVTYYNPATITDFEGLIIDFLIKQGFAQYSAGTTHKVVMAGQNFITRFNKAFRQYRRTDSLEGTVKKKLGLNLQSYELPFGFNVSLVRNDHALRPNSPWSNWAFVLEPPLMELKVVKDYETRMFSSERERDINFLIEWQGTMSWHLEEHFALLRTK